MRDRSTLLAGRYRLGAALGRGGSGRVFRARDLLTSREVAAKLLSVDEGVSAARVQLEVASLRALRIPGVVTLLDHGVDAGVPWIVTDVIEGRPFPGRRAPARWEQVRQPLVTLLDALGRIHAAGVVHRDLKPANVLVDRAGESTVLDLGIAQLGTAHTPGLTAREGVFGSVRYMAPERHEGLGDVPSDLFSVGVMLYEALTGEHPFCDDNDPTLSRRAVLRGLRVPLDARRPDLPAAVCALCHALLRAQPTQRPRSAEEALAQLDAEGRVTVVARTPVEQLTGLDRLLHLREDAASELLARAPDSLEAQAQELRRWIAARDATRRGDEVATTREALDRLRNERAPESRGVLAALRAAVRDGARLSAKDSGEALRVARGLCESGALGRAEHLLAELLHALSHERRDEPALHETLALWLEAGTQSQSARVVDRAVYAMLRLEDLRLDAMITLGRAWHASMLWTPDALERVALVPPQASDGLEMARRNLRVSAARRRWGEDPDIMRDVAAREADEAETRGGAWRSRAALWRGRLAYAEGDFEQAARWYERAVDGETWRSARLNATLNAASAWMEAFAFRRAIDLAERARAEAALCRLAFFEGRAEWLARTARDRCGEALTPDIDLVSAGEEVAAELGLLLATTEATIAWRRCDRATVQAMAAVVRRARGVTGEAMATMVVEMLAGAMDDRAQARGRAVARRALNAGLPRLALEALALGWGDGSAGPEERELARRLAEQIPIAHWGARLGALSAEECLRRVGQG